METDKDLINAVLNRSKEEDGVKKLSCAQAFQLAQECDARIIEIGRICNEENIRICNCQLGCFK